MFLGFRFFLQMRPYFPTEVEDKGVSSKLMVMAGVYMCYKVMIWRIQVIKQTYVNFLKCLYQNDPKNPIFVPYFLLEKSHISHIFFKWAACHKEINVTCKYKICAEEN